MDHKTSNPETESWVNDRMAQLQPAAEWNPDTGRAFKRLSERKPALNAPWMRVAMTTTIVAATVLVLVMLPWQGLWTSQMEGRPAQASRTTAAAAQASITQPSLIHSVQPEYTPEAKQAKIQGVIEVVITVKEDGTARFESFKKTLGYGLDERAREAVEQWLFTAGTKDGKPVATMVTVSLGFRLK
jgi:TonB family protein